MCPENPFTGELAFNAERSDLSSPAPKKWLRQILATSNEVHVSEVAKKNGGVSLRGDTTTGRREKANRLAHHVENFCDNSGYMSPPPKKYVELLSALGSNKARNAYVRRATIDRAKADRAIFLRLRSIDAATKARLFPLVRRSINRVHSERLTRAQGIILFLEQMAISYAVIGALEYWIFTSGGLLPAWMAVVGGVLSYVSVFLLPGKTGPARPGSPWKLPRPFLIYPITVILFVLARSMYFADQYYWFRLVLAFLGGASVIGGFFVGIFVGLFPFILRSARQLRRQSDAVILTRLIQLLDDVERGKLRWYELSFKADTNRELDAIANLLQRDLVSQYSTRDAEFSRWIADRSWRMAAWLRDLKKWTSLSRSDTFQYFTAQLANIIILIAEGNWDCLPCASEGQPSFRERGLPGILQTIRSLASAIAPALILLLINRLSVKLPEVVMPYLYLGVTVWTAVGLVALLDPLYSSKFETVKAALQLLPGAKKKE